MWKRKKNQFLRDIRSLRLNFIANSQLQYFYQALQVLARCLLPLWFVITLSGTALSDWRQEIGAFRIVIAAPKATAEIQARLEPFRLAVQSQLDTSTEVRIETNLERLILNQSERPAEYMVIPASAYAVIWRRCECVEPLMVARSANGHTAIRGVLIVRGNSNISSPTQLAGKTVLGLSKSSVASFAMANRAISKSGSTSADWQFSKSAENAIYRFLAGEGDAIAGWIPASGSPNTHETGTLARLKQLGTPNSEYRIVWQSGNVPNKVHAIRQSIDGEAKRLLRDLMRTLDQDDPVAYDALEPDFAGGFETARPGMFSDLVKFFDVPDSEN